MGPVILKPPMEATTSVIVPTLARIASFNSVALSSEAREREGGGEGEGERGRTNMRQGSLQNTEEHNQLLLMPTELRLASSNPT